MKKQNWKFRIYDFIASFFYNLREDGNIIHRIENRFNNLASHHYKDEDGEVEESGAFMPCAYDESIIGI